MRLCTELRRNVFSAYKIENYVIAITGQVDVVRRLAFQVCGLAPRIRKFEMDGQELMQVHDEPGQFKEDGKFRDPKWRGSLYSQKIARFNGLDRPGRRRLVAMLKASGFPAEVDESGCVLAEYCGARKAELDLVVAAAPIGGFQLGGTR